jgi:hypothetical protein
MASILVASAWRCHEVETAFEKKLITKRRWSWSVWCVLGQSGLRRWDSRRTSPASDTELDLLAVGVRTRDDPAEKVLRVVLGEDEVLVLVEHSEG